VQSAGASTAEARLQNVPACTAFISLKTWLLTCSFCALHLSCSWIVVHANLSVHCKQSSPNQGVEHSCPCPLTLCFFSLSPKILCISWLLHFQQLILKTSQRSCVVCTSMHVVYTSCEFSFHFISYLTVWGVEPLVPHQTSWLESTGVS